MHPKWHAFPKEDKKKKSDFLIQKFAKIHMPPPFFFCQKNSLRKTRKKKKWIFDPKFQKFPKIHPPLFFWRGMSSQLCLLANVLMIL
jgi:hypothetical protein